MRNGDVYRATAEGKAEQAKYHQGYKSIKPLLKHLHKGTLSSEILDNLYQIVQYCLMKEYNKAHDKYVELAIGNSPWPMGVTMVGIHERSGRSRINTS
jgi:pre-mRNA-splicing factor 18